MSPPFSRELLASATVLARKGSRPTQLGKDSHAPQLPLLPLLLLLLSPWLVYKALTTGKYRRGLWDKLFGPSLIRDA